MQNYLSLNLEPPPPSSPERALGGPDLSTCQEKAIPIAKHPHVCRMIPYWENAENDNAMLLIGL